MGQKNKRIAEKNEVAGRKTICFCKKRLSLVFKKHEGQRFYRGHGMRRYCFARIEKKLLSLHFEQIKIES